MVALARRRRVSLGRIALASESRLLGLAETQVVGEIGRRLAIMEDSVRRGLRGGGLSLKLLAADGRQDPQAPRRPADCRAAAYRPGPRPGPWPPSTSPRSGGVVCAAPTGGSAGVLPGVLVTLAEERAFDRERTALALSRRGRGRR